jgi:hypothetical protein
MTTPAAEFAGWTRHLTVSCVLPTPLSQSLLPYLPHLWSLSLWYLILVGHASVFSLHLLSLVAFLSCSHFFAAACCFSARFFFFVLFVLLAVR